MGQVSGLALIVTILQSSDVFCFDAPFLAKKNVHKPLLYTIDFRDLQA